MKVLSTCVVGLAVVITAPGNASTYQMLDIECSNYARNAINHQQENIDRACGFSGPRWNEEFEYHYKWCTRGNNRQHIKSESQARTSELGRCRWCVNYAQNAVKQQNENVDRGCGLRGPRWSAVFDYHRNWCMHGENHRYNDREFNARAQALAKCR